MERLNRVVQEYDFSTIKTVSEDNPYPVDCSGGVVWGYYSGRVYRSFDGGRVWSVLPPTPTDGGELRRVSLMKDGSVLLVFATKLYRSIDLVHWEQKIDSTDGGLYWWSIGTDGTKVIVAEYGLPRTDCKYYWVSLNHGSSFTRYEKNVVFPGDDAGTHFHGAAYDAKYDRFWLCLGDVTYEGHFYSEDNGATWTEVPLGTSMNPAGAQATTITPSKTGMVLTSDTANNSGVFRIPYEDDAANMRVNFAYKLTDEIKLQGFAFKNEYHAPSGITFSTWRTEHTGRGPFITWTNGVEGGMFYEWTGAFSAKDSFRNIAITPEGRILAWLFLGGQSPSVLTFERFYIT